MFLPATPFTVSNRPPMYTVFLSSDAVTARTTDLDAPRATLSTQLVGAPVAASSTTSRDRLMLDELPSAVPGGRTWVKSPPANTLPCAAASPQTVPLVCHVGNASAVKWIDGANASAGDTTAKLSTNATSVPNAESLRIAFSPSRR